MVVFSLKLLNNLRKAIADRRFPRQLAAGCACGVMLGIIPHGNLLAVVVLLTLLTFQINHALMAAVAIGISFIATGLDGYSHQLGEYLLTHPKGHQLAMQAWALPFVPWTDLNNTVVLGSFLIGLASVWPVYKVTLPLFRMVAPAEEETDEKKKDAEVDSQDQSETTVAISQSQSAEASTESSHATTSDAVAPVSVRIDDATSASRPPRWQKKSEHGDVTAIDQVHTSLEPRDDLAVRPPSSLKPAPTTASPDELPSNEQMVSIETKIDVIRMKDYRDKDDPAGDDITEPTSNDEALNYLLQQLRHSQQRKAAG
ncbi:TIGR03546 family protein [Roseiconus lacunae]|uniref:TIGR03546 family protein n=1 Tax=Roseiconus lacunae TaxID=2605694 RepID=A0ABT7PIV6_9BACT|nr:TIGR03546 family protein [Roseiconus lacunae]MDM4016196.1 TIGR03546 family protein [Roseiconus lacunae]